MATVTKTLMTTSFAVVLVERGVARVLIESQDRDQIGEAYKAAKRRHAKADQAVKLVARETEWDVIAEL